MKPDIDPCRVLPQLIKAADNCQHARAALRGYALSLRQAGEFGPAQTILDAVNAVPSEHVWERRS